MLLTQILGKATPEYVELGWVCAANATGQTITQDILTPLYMNTIVRDTGNNVMSLTPGSVPDASITTNFTLKPGTYYVEGESNSSSGAGLLAILLRNNTLQRIEARGLTGSASTYYAYYTRAFLKSQFVIDVPCNFTFMGISSINGIIKNDRNATDWAGAANQGNDIQQRSTIRFWKLL